MKPGALTDLLRQVAATPAQREDEPPPLLPGSVVGRFEIVREVGRGGFGVVYEARDRELGRLVALKTVRAGAAIDEEARVVREAEAIARLSHPNLITLHDLGRSERGPYLVFEFLHGKTLQERLDDGPLQVREAVHIAVEVARGLAHAHGEGVVHRDLKPSNVFVTNKGQVKILDFGLAHAFGRRRVSGGTPAYMAPEQWEEDPEDERTDVFALGVMLFRMLSGELPFPEGEGRWSAEPATSPRLDVAGEPGLAELVARMLEKAPKGRPRDGAAVLAALTPIEEALRARPADGSPPIRATRRKATLADLLAELKRRRVFRVMVGYGIFAFAVLQVTEPVLHAYDLPGWLLTVVVTSVAAGFPLAIVLAWLFDLTARGVERTPSATGRGAASISRGQLAWLLAAAAITAALPGIGWYAWKQASERRHAAALPVAGPSIAVLPFADMSPGKDQDYLAEGIAEEVLDALARVDGLRVVGRTSSWYFKGKNARLSEIGRELRVEAVLEGSIRREGSRLRVAAKLLSVRDGRALWSESYDRDLRDVLSVEAEIARKVAGATSARLVVGNRAGQAAAPPVTSDAYLQFLLGRSLLIRGSEADVARSVEEFEKALALEPGFSRAWAGYSLALVRSADQRTGLDALLAERRRAMEAAERAVATGPTEPEALLARGFQRALSRHEWREGLGDLERAAGLGASGATAWRAPLLAALGRLKEALEAMRKCTDDEPLWVMCWNRTGLLANAAGQFDRARTAYRRALEIAPDNDYARAYLAQTDLLEGRFAAALGADGEPRSPVGAGYATMTRALVHHALGHPEESRRALEEMVERYPHNMSFQIAEVSAWRGDPDTAFLWLERARERLDSGLWMVRMSPFLRSLHADPRWPVLLRKLNLPAD